MKHIVIIGNGIAGVTAARHIRKNSDYKITIISGETEYFFSRTAIMYVYMGHMKFEHTQPYENDFWKKNNIDLIFDFAEKIDYENQSIFLQKGNSINYDKLILATGSKSVIFNWEGKDANGVMSLYKKQDLDKLIEMTPKIKKAIVIGGGLIGIELCEMLASQKIKTTFLIRENSFWNTILPKDESIMVSNHIKDHHIDIRFNMVMSKILKDDKNNVKGILTENDEKIDCDLVGICVGVTPNIDFIKSTELKTNRGILVNKYLETNIPNIYAIGDCAELTLPKIGRSPIEAVWYCGRMMGETVAQTITKKPTEYNPGVWFNSAKLFDIEYVTYGKVSSVPIEDEGHLYWQHPSKNISIRLSYDKETGITLGAIGMGLRLSHTFFDQIIREEWKIDKSIENLHLANFDPEFFDNYFNDIKTNFLEKIKTQPYGSPKKHSFNCSI